MAKQNNSTVVIVGRINVGKSSLFNRLTGTKKAIVSRIPGTTRDYNMGQVEWGKKWFDVIDTGGVDIDVLKNSIQILLASRRRPANAAPTVIEKEIIRQTQAALEKADLVIMVVDGQAGVLPQDKELALVLKKIGKPIMLVCNKVDNQRFGAQINDFYKLGVGTPYPLSAANGSGVGDFLDELIEHIKKPEVKLKVFNDPETITVSMIGKPNAGKSSLVNKILGEQRVIVSPVAQTTREPQDTDIIFKDQKITLIDTAGLRKRARISSGLERAATRRTLQMINRTDVLLLVTEANEPLTKQDAHLAGMIKDSGASIIVIANKWDLLTDKDTKTDAKIRQYYQGTFPFLSFAPLLFISALTGKNVDSILDTVLTVAAERKKEVEPEKLHHIADRLVIQHRPSQAKGVLRPHIYDISQTRTSPPEFTITIGPRQSLHFSYVRFIENQIRENFGFLGTPVRIRVKALKR